MTSDFTFRLGTTDWHIFNEVAIGNEYRIETFTPEDVIVDVGAHIGTFAAVCMWSGAGKVICYEPSAENVRLLRKNLAAFPQCVVHERAIWRSGVPELVLAGAEPNRAAGHCLGDMGMPVAVTSLDDALCEAGTVRMLKIDCEGGEWPSLYSCSELWRVQEIAGELHTQMVNPEWPWDCTVEGLTAHLGNAGFVTEVVPGKAGNALFFARRQP